MGNRTDILAGMNRREWLALGIAAASLPLLPGAARAKVLKYQLDPVEIAQGVWTVYGLPEPITAKNGGAIANITIFDTKDGAVLVDAGPSHRYGEALKALAQELTKKPVARVYITHYHTDHVLGATAFDDGIVSGGPALAEDLKRSGNDLTNAMYRVAGDWMRGTGIPQPGRTAANGIEEIGGRRFRTILLAGHTREDLCLYEEGSGLLFPGDLVFLDRAATTPDAKLDTWRASLKQLAELDHKLLVPGHGPVEPGTRGIEQTNRWLDTVQQAIETGFEQGLDETELMTVPLPAWTESIAVGRHEFGRSVMHLMPGLEVERLPTLKSL